MPICGCCCWGWSERGAFGFSKEKSLAYWARALRDGALASAWAPLPAGVSAIERAPDIEDVIGAPMRRGKAAAAGKGPRYHASWRRTRRGKTFTARRSLVGGTGGCYEPRAPYAFD